MCVTMNSFDELYKCIIIAEEVWQFHVRSTHKWKKAGAQIVTTQLPTASIQQLQTSLEH